MSRTPRPTNAEVSDYLQRTFGAGPRQASALATQVWVMTRVVRPLIATLLGLTALAVLFRVAWPIVLGVTVVVLVAIPTSLLSSVVFVGAVFKRPGATTPDPFMPFAYSSLFWNLVVRRLGPRWRGDDTFVATSVPRAPRTKLGRTLRKIFWGAGNSIPWNDDAPEGLLPESSAADGPSNDSS